MRTSRRPLPSVSAGSTARSGCATTPLILIAGPRVLRPRVLSVQCWSAWGAPASPPRCCRRPSAQRQAACQCWWRTTPTHSRYAGSSSRATWPRRCLLLPQNQATQPKLRHFQPISGTLFARLAAMPVRSSSPSPILAHPLRSWPGSGVIVIAFSTRPMSAGALLR